MTPQEFTARVLPILTVHGASVTSWYRTARHNRAIGGRPTSSHLTATAVDVVLDDESDANALLDSCAAANLRAIREADHIHIAAPQHA